MKLPRRGFLHLAAGAAALPAASRIARAQPYPARPVRIVVGSGGSGHEAMKFLPPAVRNRLLRRALSFQPQAAVANGDHVYWDLLSPLTSQALRCIG